MTPIYLEQDAAIIPPNGEPHISDPEMVALAINNNKVQQVDASEGPGITTNEKEENPTYSEYKTDRLTYLHFMKKLRGYFKRAINIQRGGKVTKCSTSDTTRVLRTRRSTKNVRPKNISRIRVVHPNLKALLLAQLLNCHNTADT